MNSKTHLQLSLTNLNTAIDFVSFQKFLRGEAKHRFANAGIDRVLFIPYAYDGNDYNGYITKVKDIFSPLYIDVTLITEGDPAQLIDSAQGIVIGGNDLGRLLIGMTPLYSIMRKKLKLGIPYMSWNAGSVFVSPTYIQQPAIPINTDCLSVVENQHICNYVDSLSNQLVIKAFLNSHQNIPRVVCMLDTLLTLPDGSGLRYEDDDAGLVYAPIPGTIPPIAFENTEFGFIQV